jgi:lipoate-protein ligase A
MFSVLNVPNEKIKDKFISNVRERVTSIKNILSENISFNKIENSMKIGFEEEFNVELNVGKLTNDEIILTKKFKREFFSNDNWNHKR